MGHFRPLFFIFVFSIQLTVNIQILKIQNFCRWLDSNCGPLKLEVTALPTEPPPRLPLNQLVIDFKIVQVQWCNSPYWCQKFWQEIFLKYWSRRWFRVGANNWISQASKSANVVLESALVSMSRLKLVCQKYKSATTCFALWIDHDQLADVAKVNLSCLKRYC